MWRACSASVRTWPSSSAATPRAVHRKPFASSKRDVLLKLFGAALEAVDGRRRTAEALSGMGDEPVWVVAVGKAAAAMSLGAYDKLGSRIQAALVITKDGHGSDELALIP